MATHTADGLVPVISVVLPVYNGEKFIGEAVQSILDQTFTNFELIAIDDGSTDQTLAILERFRSLDHRVKVVSRENRGLVETLNEGVALAKGAWVARMDADDVSSPIRFERQLLRLQDTGADICGTWIKFFGTSDRRELRHPQGDEAIKVALLFGSPFAHSTVMAKKAFFSQFRYSKQWEACEDYELWERAARAGLKMTNVPEVLLSYRLHETQISAVSTRRQLTLSQQVRYRYWESVCDTLEFRREWIVEVIGLRASPVHKSDMDKTDAAFSHLLGRFHGESRAIIFHHMTRLYLRAAGQCRDIVPRWSRMNDRFGPGTGIGVKMELFFLSLLRLRPDTKIHALLRNLYSRLGG
jgi:Glycosyl transferase family 2